MYGNLRYQKLFPNEQKRFGNNSRGTKDQLLIGKAILINCWRGLTNLSMACMEYRKTYDMMPHSWLLECGRIVGVAQNIITLIENSLAIWKPVLPSNPELLGIVDIKRGIFQGESLPPLLFVIIIIPLSLILGLTTNWRKKAISITCSLWMT